MICQSIGRDVVGLDERGIEQIAKGNSVARLKSDVVLARAGKGLGRNRDDLVEIARLVFRPIEHHYRRRNLCQAAYLAFLPRVLFLQHVTSLRIDEDECLCRCGQTDAARKHDKRGKDDENSAESNHGGAETQHLNRRVPVGNFNQAAFAYAVVVANYYKLIWARWAY
jgi:hypothetical protein